MRNGVKRYGLHLGLFAATCVTTTWALGLEFSATLMAILVCHEMGHYVAARYHCIGASLPYFIPTPPGITFGTLGAVIRMDAVIQDRNKLFDVGAAGPLAGLIVAVPLLVYGLSISSVGPVPPGGAIEGNSLAYIALKYAVTGMYLPAYGIDVSLHPIAFGAWVGFLITMINLIPIGQLDGGHIAAAYLGDRHERTSRWLHVGLGIVAVGVGGWAMRDAVDAGRGLGSAIAYGARAAAPWFVWASILVWMRYRSAGVYHPPVGAVPLTRSRRIGAFCLGIVFVLIFTPVPLREGL